MVDPILTVAPALVLLLVVELLVIRHRHQGSSNKSLDKKDISTSLAIGLVNQATSVLKVGSGAAALLVAASITPFHLPSGNIGIWILTLILADLAYYGAHRAQHRIRILWANHSIHHSSQHFNTSAGFRLPPLFFLTILNKAVYIPLALIGIPPPMILTAELIILLYQFPIHTEQIRMLWRPIEFVFNTPSHHRVHHGSNKKYLDKNYGGIFIIWDRLFNSYAHEDEVAQFGLTKNVDTYNPIKVVLHELSAIAADVRGTPRWRDRLGYAFAPPGWAPTARSGEDGSNFSASWTFASRVKKL
ncbi:sterol desaturase family protein [Rhodococcus erythropolis]|uniref:sterol desaturase family protein n=1 Tax=Rhodococcus erythropolis TaxID=1833 RepID=UPI0029494D5E|nr:sterol desaturase family protein [Rhodococcus erythropolis]MDV6277928.1 sterol desaturase family protein [Rhodococcus erythropolis]